MDCRMTRYSVSMASLDDSGQTTGADTSMGRLGEEAKQERAVGIMEPMVVVPFLRHLATSRCTHHGVNYLACCPTGLCRGAHTGPCAAGRRGSTAARPPQTQPESCRLRALLAARAWNMVDGARAWIRGGATSSWGAKRTSKLRAQAGQGWGRSHL